jgi:hypothetical protein
MQHQISHATKYNRYPDIFQACVEYFDRDINILSFGCSDGTEVKTLRELYFPTSNIHGVDISQKMVDQCNTKLKDDNTRFTLPDKLDKNYDLIFCMSVLCRWPQTEKINDCSSEYKFSEFETQLSILHDNLASGGLLVIYNSNFCFFESKIYPLYYPLTKEFPDSGFVHKFNSENKKVNINYRDCIFIKK